MGMGTTHTATTGMDTEFLLTGLMWLSSRTTATNPTLAVARTIHMASRQHLIRITSEVQTNPNLAISGIADSPDAGRPPPWWHAIPPACWPSAAAWRRSPIDGCSSDGVG